MSIQKNQEQLTYGERTSLMISRLSEAEKARLLVELRQHVKQFTRPGGQVFNNVVCRNSWDLSSIARRLRRGMGCRGPHLMGGNGVWQSYEPFFANAEGAARMAACSGQVGGSFGYQALEHYEGAFLVLGSTLQEEVARCVSQ